MARKIVPTKKLLVKVQELTAQLHEAQQTLEAIYTGDVDALVVAGPGGDQVFTLKGAEEPYRLLVERMQEGAATIGDDGIILYCNQRMASMLRMGLETIIGSPIASLVTPEQSEQLETLLRQGRDDRSHGEIALRAADGSDLPVMISAARMPIDGVDVLGLVITDLSEQKVRAREMANYQNQLRALAITLTQAEQRERRRLAAVLHDHLQQLLVAVKLHIQGVNHARPARAQGPSVKASMDLLDQAIQVSRSLTMELSPPVLYTQGLAAAISWLLRWMKDKHGLTAAFTGNGDTDRLSDDVRGFLFQVVRELLFNVVKHSETNQAIVTFTCSQDRGLEIIVRDEGVGFNPKTFGVSEAAEGFGLFSIHERISLLGGKIHIDSAKHKGTSVTVWMPSPPPASADETADATLDTPARGAVTAPKNRSDPGRKIRVALADDHPILREGLAELLRNEPNLEVVGEAEDGHAVIELARRLRPDIILMDVSMPRLGGIEATKIIAAELPSIRVIALSMHDEESIAAAMREAGAVCFVTKGGSSENLIRVIQNCMGEEAVTTD